MNRILLLFSTALLIADLSYAQMSYRINGLRVEPGRKSLPYEFGFETLEWGKVLSDCIKPTGAETGLWFTLKATGPEITVTVKTGPKMGDIKEPIVYLGTEVISKGQKILTQIACAKAEKGQNEVSVSAKDLEAKKEYYILVTSANPLKKELFAMELTESYTAPKLPQQAQAQEPPKITNYIIGRIRKSNGDPKEGATVTLLNEKMERIESAKTDPQGSFRFEKLPQEQTYLTRIEEAEPELIVDMFLYDNNGNVKQRATLVGPNLYGFGAESDGFPQLKLLTENDWKLDVKAGKAGIAGRIVDSQTFLFGQKDVEIGLYNSAKARLAIQKTDADGRFAFRDIDKGNYMIKVENNKEGTYSEMVIVDDLNVPTEYSNSGLLATDGFFKFEKLPAEIVQMKQMEERDTRMKAPTDFSQMEEGKPIVLKNILFASGSSELLESSFAELDRLAEELKKRTTIKIEISGHTDNTGNENTNKLLSESRAKAVKDYLISKGVAESRLVHRGYGQAKPVASNDTEEGRKQNRRVEFVVVK